MPDSSFKHSNLSNISLMNSYCSYNESDTDLEKITKRTVFALLTFLGMALNIFVIIIGAKYTVRKHLHHLIINIAVSDTLFLLMWLLANVPWLSYEKWSIYPSGTLGVIGCKTTLSLVNVSFRVSLITLLVISIERFKATRSTFQKRFNGIKRRVLALSICWLIPMVDGGCFMYIATLRNGVRLVRRADLQNYIVIGLIIFLDNIAIFILCCGIVLLSILTIRQLSKQKAIESYLSEGRQNIQARRTQSAVKMVLASVLVYTCCGLPLFVYSAMQTIDNIIPSVDIMNYSACYDWSSLSFIVQIILPVINSCFSPCIYITFLSDFRDAAKKILWGRNVNRPLQETQAKIVQVNKRRKQNSIEDHVM